MREELLAGPATAKMSPPQHSSKKKSKKKSSKNAKQTGFFSGQLSLSHFGLIAVGMWYFIFIHYEASPVVTTTNGDIQGRKVSEKGSAPHFVFTGIPYAKPPVGDLRFKDPQREGLRWEGVRRAVAEGPICPQLPMRLNETKFKERVFEKLQSPSEIWEMIELIPALVRRSLAFYTQSEDCLYLNVATPVMTLNETKGEDLRAVFVWIHGGAFLVGDGGFDAQGPRHFINEDIVLVTINYRLGPLGFLNLQNSAAPGNAGAKDVVAALHWVKDNIRQFGGNPDRVTVGGNSAGAALAHYLTLSPLAKGLIHGVIAQSGSALHHWTFTSAEHAKKRAHLLADVVAGNKEARTDDQVLAILKTASASDITAAVEHCVEPEEIDLAMDEFPFQLSPEVEVQGSQLFLPAPPLHLLRTSQIENLPMILGVTSREGIFWYLSILFKKRGQYEELKRLQGNLHQLLPEYMREHLEPGSTEMAILEKKMRKLYFQGRGLHQISVEDYLLLFGDLMFVFDTHRLTRELAAASKAPVYVYNFTATGKLNVFSTMVLYDGEGGASHADDLGYMWDVSMIPTGVVESGDREDNVRKNLVAMWANFIRTGNPTPATNQSERGHTPDIVWPSISNADTPVLRIDHPPSIQSGLRQEEMMFWDDVYRQATSPARQRLHQANIH